jgi:hypothetical protein
MKSRASSPALVQTARGPEPRERAAEKRFAASPGKEATGCTPAKVSPEKGEAMLGSGEQSRRRLVISAVVFLAAAVLLAAGGTADWSGVVERTDGAQVKLAGVPEPFVVGGGVTEFLTGRALSISDLAIGASVTLRAVARDSQGRLVAREAQVRPSGATTLSGQVEAVAADGTSLRVQGLEVSVDSKTAVGGRVHSVRDLQPGQAVSLTLQGTPAGGLRAAEIVAGDTSDDGAEEQEAAGVLTELDPTSFQLDSSAVFQVTADTRFVGDPQVGDLVEVRFHTGAQGNAIADLVRKEDPEDGGQEVEFKGTVESIAADQWTISGQTVLVNGDTRIEGNPQVGDTVEVHAVQSVQGLLATHIDREDNAPPPQPPQAQHVEFEGTVESVGTIWMISGQAVTVNASTRISDNPGVGDTVRVEAMKQADGSLLALQIEKQDGGHGDDGDRRRDRG